MPLWIPVLVVGVRISVCASCSYLEDLSDILHVKEIPHQTIVGTLDDVAGILHSAQKLGIQVAGLLCVHTCALGRICKPTPWCMLTLS